MYADGGENPVDFPPYVIQCPQCSHYFLLELKVPEAEAKEVKGAGWWCDNCGQFSGPQINKCVYCGAKRKK